MNNLKNCNTALIGCGYWGTNIAKVLNTVKKGKSQFLTQIYQTQELLKKDLMISFLFHLNWNNLLIQKKYQILY